jgi:23S rRNA pseudouridine1911/1915/1917 synthase
MDTLNVIYEDNHLLVVNKPPGVLSQADGSLKPDIVNQAKQYLKEKYNKPGNVFCGLVHRLDQPVGGVMVLAKTSKAAARLSQQFSKNKVTRIYHCIVENQPPLGWYEDYLSKNKRTNTSYVSKDGKLAQLEVLSVKMKQNWGLVKIKLHTGRPHQIRVQMASRNFPILNDHRYHPEAKKRQDIALCANSLSFKHPTLKDQLTFEVPLPTTYPWSIFNS